MSTKHTDDSSPKPIKRGSVQDTLLSLDYTDEKIQPEKVDEFEPVDGGFRAWLVCVTSFWCNGTLFGILNIFGLLFVALKDEFANSTDEDLAFKICT